MMKARLGVAGLGVAAALLFSACGNGPPEGSAGTAAAGGGGDVGSKVTGQTAATTAKETDDLHFNPSSSTVKVGDVVEWDNAGSVAHNVTFDQYSAITSDTMNSGDKYQVKFTKAGTYQYHCTFHPGMDGTITVS
ncbi:MAG TPA: plastocyanin/azurin family copper-binding protein [Candidatus Dormibacteraeota bacterium]|jgi:plastocyanin|nr:plastocyanin/azurin family copper-binding protein [Candidatus Dormibacteraeota bacterium]